ncbi:unnamed protein product, partial [Ectocarpus sp. 13 AM-2016]
RCCTPLARCCCCGHCCDVQARDICEAVWLSCFPPVAALGSKVVFTLTCPSHRPSTYTNPRLPLCDCPIGRLSTRARLCGRSGFVDKPVQPRRSLIVRLIPLISRV